MHPKQAKKKFEKARQHLEEQEAREGRSPEAAVVLLIRAYNGLASSERGCSYNSSRPHGHLNDAQAYADKSLALARKHFGESTAWKMAYPQERIRERRDELARAAERADSGGISSTH